jgi:endonuclease/exonuclease/phosphatase family metal-dependent hydrolase
LHYRLERKRLACASYRVRRLGKQAGRLRSSLRLFSNLISFFSSLPDPHPVRQEAASPFVNIARSLIFFLLIALLVFGVAQNPAARAFVSPSRPQSVRVMTYNIHVGVGMDKKLDLPRIAGVINAQHPDLVGLQEVDRGVTRTQQIDEIAELARLTKMDYAFAFNLKFQGGQYGVAILSRTPIRTTEHRLYLNTREAERRGFIRAQVYVGKVFLSFVTTHLDYQHDDERLFETTQLLAALRDVKEPLILVGDFNDVPAGDTYKLVRSQFNDAWIDSNKDAAGFSYPADKPAKRIDYILTRSSDSIRTKRSWIVETLASDHVPVVADLEIGNR